MPVRRMAFVRYPVGDTLSGRRLQNAAESNDADAILGATESLPPRKATAGIGEPRKGFDGKVQDISGWGPGP